MSDVEFIEFKENSVSFNIVLGDDEIKAFKEEWSRVKGCQPPLIDVTRNGVNLFIPWIMGGKIDE